MLDKQGARHTARASIVEVFAAFYEDLYESKNSATSETVHQGCKEIQAFTKEDLEIAIKQMKRGKAKDNQGVIAEMLKDGNDTLYSAFLELFNEVLVNENLPPSAWRDTKLVVIFKKGDPMQASNYRPIAILPILYKLFSRMLCSRLMSALMSQQSTDQAAYRKGFSTEDHLLTLTLLLEKSGEWNVDTWLGLVDFEKAFDTVEHDALWTVLKEQTIEPAYIELLKKLYKQQTAFLKNDVER